MAMDATHRLIPALACVLALGCGDDARVPAPPDPNPPVVAPTKAPVARVETTDAWLDLIAQRPNAVALDHGAVVVDLDRKAARKHLALGYRDVWALEQTVGDRGGAVIAGRTAAVDLPVDAELAPGLNADGAEHPALAIAVTVRAMASKQSMTVLWNEQPLAHLRIDDNWARRTLSVPGDQVRPGENRLRLHFRRTAAWYGREASAAVARIELGTHDRIKERPEGEGARYRVQPLGAGKTSVFLPPGGGLAYYFVAPTRGKLVLGLRGRGAVRVTASTTDDHRQGRAPTLLLDEPLRETGRRSELDLTAWGGAPVRLAIEARGSEDASGLTLTTAKVLARRTVPVDRRSREPRDIIVLSVEGARADAFAVGRRPPLAAFDALMSESLVFERAYAPSPAAVPTHAGWLSSVAPPVHLTVRGTFVADRQSLIPEGLARSGFYRVLASANEYVNAERGLVQGFDHVEVLGGAVEDDSARAVFAAAAKLLAGHRERWFLLADVDDPQAPYDPPREMLRDAVPPPGSPLPHLTHIWVGRVRMGKTEPSRKEVAYVRRLYRGELQVVDEALGELVEALRKRGRYDDAIVVVIGAHGRGVLRARRGRPRPHAVRGELAGAAHRTRAGLACAGARRSRCRPARPGADVVRPDRGSRARCLARREPRPGDRRPTSAPAPDHRVPGRREPRRDRRRPEARPRSGTRRTVLRPRLGPGRIAGRRRHGGRRLAGRAGRARVAGGLRGALATDAVGHGREPQARVCPRSRDVVIAGPLWPTAVKKLLDSIPALVKKKDAAALVGLRDHDDKKVRKAVRKALHVLSTKGVEIPEAAPKSWTAGDALQQMRGDLEPSATVDTKSMPGAMRFVLSEPDEAAGARLFVGALSPDDRVLDFQAFHQTDGQRSRLVRDWEKRRQERKVPPEWIRARLAYARAQTIAAGFSVPRTLDEAMPNVGDPPDERPGPFMADQLAKEKAFKADDIDDMINELSIAAWPPLCDLDSTLQRAAEIHGDKPQPTEDDERLALLTESVKDDESVRRGLAGPVANALEDAAVYKWQDGELAIARAGLDMAAELRASKTPETIAWVPKLLGFQVASLLRAVGGPDAIRQAQAQADGQDHAHDHSHSHSHDHEH